MPTHHVVAGDTLSKIARANRLTLSDLLALNPEFKANPNDIRVGDVVNLGGESRAPQRKKKQQRKPKKSKRKTSTPGSGPARGPFVVQRGQLTFDSEGMEGGPFHSRRLHVPSPSSGATIGRGYDMGARSKNEIVSDLVEADVDRADASSLARLRGLRGNAAESEIARLHLDDFEITPEQQKRLFRIVYGELAGDVRRICEKHDVVAKYGATDCDGLEVAIRDVVVDLRYRGDYTGTTREKVQPCVVENGLGKLSELMADRNYWVVKRGVPSDRFRRRNEFLS